MPIDINLDRRLENAWFHHEWYIKNLKRNRRSVIQIEMSNGKTPWEASEAFNDELKRIEEMRRVEIDHLYSLIQTENREKQKMEQEEQQQRKRDLSAKRERQRLKREEIKMNPPAPRRSARVANKNKTD